MSDEALNQDLDDPIFDAIVKFTRAYHPQLEENFDARGRHLFPHHGDRAGIILIIKGSDGYVTFYLPTPPPGEGIEKGFRAYDHSSHDLNTICQSLHVNRLKIAPPMLGSAWDAFVQPENTDPIPGFSPALIHDDIRTAAGKGLVRNLPGMTLGVPIYVEKGVRSHLLPERSKIWSPVFDIEDVGFRRLYQWTHADFWWLPEKLDLSSARVAQTAAFDIMALQAVTVGQPPLTVDDANQDVAKLAADKLDEQCDELVALLEADGGNEEAIHQFLYRPENHLFLDTDHIEVKSKVPFGDYISDFVIRRSDQTYKLIEIETAAKRIFTASKSEPTADFNHARQQVLDWQDYVREHVAHVRDVQRLQGIHEPAGMVLMGRSADIDSDKARKRWRAMRASDHLELQTYDDVIVKMRNLAERLRTLLR